MAFLKEKNEERKLEEIPPEQLNDFLSEFIITVKTTSMKNFTTNWLFLKYYQSDRLYE